MAAARVVRRARVGPYVDSDEGIGAGPRRVDAGLCLALTVVGVFCLMAVFANQIAPHSPTDGFLSNRLLPPLTAAGGSYFVLGTDDQGRDILSRLIFGARTSLSVAAVTVLGGCIIGTLLGLVAAYNEGSVDALLMRAVDALIGLPVILFALLFSVTLGPGFTPLVMALILISWAGYARVVRSEALGLKRREFFEAARALGAPWPRILFRHLWPNVEPTVIVLATSQVGFVVVAEAALSFIGAGIPPPAPAWGSMIASGRAYLVQAWWISLFPGLAIVAFVLAVNATGEWLRRRSDPRLFHVR
jgi:peptide/nickel transport system permease protein